MSPYKKLAKAFTTWRSSQKSSSESKQNLNERLEHFFDAQQRVKEYMTYANQAAGMAASQNTTLSGSAGMLGQASSATWTTASNPVMTIGSNGSLGIGSVSPTYTSAHPQNVTMTVERVDNGFILRSARYQGDIAKVKICTNMDELKDLFVATLVEHQLEK